MQKRSAGRAWWLAARWLESLMLEARARARRALPQWERGGHSLATRLVALAVSWMFTATTIWAMAPPVLSAPPTVTIAEPSAGAYLPTLTPPVRVGYQDDGGVNLDTLAAQIDGQDVTSLLTKGASEAVGAIPAGAPLTQGPHTITATINDLEGNPPVAPASQTFYLDTAAPVVVITEPADSFITSAASVTVAGRVEDASPVTLHVAGQTVTCTPGTPGVCNFSTSVTLSSGINTITANATDAAGNGSSEVSVHVVSDTQAPTVVITSPAAGARVAGPNIQVTGTVTDLTPVTVEVNGQSATVTGTGPYTFSAWVPLSDGGSVSITALARDACATPNIGTATVAVAVDSVEPAVEIDAPAEAVAINGSTVQVTGRVVDASPSTATIQSSAMAEALPLTLAADGAFATDLALPASDGVVTITVTATDAVGHSHSTMRSLTVDRTVPELSVASPAAGAVVLALPLVVDGTVADASETTVTVNGTSATRTGTAWQATLASLSEGQQTLHVVATDAAGNTRALDVSVRMDLSGPTSLVITSPPPAGALTRGATLAVTGTVQDSSIELVTVNGAAATVTQQAPGVFAFSAVVALSEGDNTVLAVASDGVHAPVMSAPVTVTRDSTPPELVLTTPTSIGRTRPGLAVATAADVTSGIAEVTISVNGTVMGTFEAPPYEVTLTAPEGAEAGTTLTVTAAAVDRAGNSITSPSRGVTITAEGVVVGLVLDDATSLPIAGATARIVSRDTGTCTGTCTAAADAAGRYSLPSADASAIVTIEQPGFTSVERDCAVVLGVGTVAVDARLTALAPSVAIGAEGGELTASHPEGARCPAPEGSPAPCAVSATVTVLAGAVAGTTDFRLTLLSQQGLPALLPLGWSPRAAFDLRASGPATGPFEVTAQGLAGSEMQLVEFSASLHAWILVGSGLTPSAEGTIAFSVPAVGSFALVAADPVEPALVVPAPQSPLAGLEVVTIPATATSIGRAAPEVLAPTGGTALGTMVVSSPTVLPSGTIVQAVVTETYRMANGEQASREKRTMDILVYREREPGSPEVTAEGWTPLPETRHAQVPITASLTFGRTDVASGRIDLEILSGREGVRGLAGGHMAAVVKSSGQDAMLRIAAGALAEDTAVTLTRETGFSSFLPSAAGVDALAEVTVDLSGQVLGLPAELSAVVDAGTGGTLLVAKVDRSESVPRLAVVALAQVGPNGVTTVPGLGLPGIVEGGRYVFYRVATTIGVVSGHTRASGVGTRALVALTGCTPAGGTFACVPGAFGGGWPFVADTRADGSYVLAIPAGSAEIQATVPRTSLAGTASVAVDAAATLAQDISLSGAVTTATVKPANGEAGVSVGAAIEVTPSTAIRASSVAGATIRLLEGDPQANVTVPVRVVLSTSGRSLTVIPYAADPKQPALKFSMEYTFEATGLLDVYGGAVIVPATHFRTKDNVAPTLDTDLITFSLPMNGGPSYVTAPACASESDWGVKCLYPGTSVLIINSTSGMVLSLTAGNDGEITSANNANALPATINDVLVVTVTDPFGNAQTYRKSQFYVLDENGQRTGETAVGATGGTVRDLAGKVELRIPEGALDSGMVLKVVPIDTWDQDLLHEPPVLASDESGQPLSHFGSGIKIHSSRPIHFKREAKLAFPVPAELVAEIEALKATHPEASIDKVMFRVLQPIEQPCADGTWDCARSERQILYRTLDIAKIERDPVTGEPSKVVTASYPFPGFDNSVERHDPRTGLIDPAQIPSEGAGMVAVEAVVTAVTITMWVVSEFIPGAALPGTVVGRVLRPAWKPGASQPEYEGVPGMQIRSRWLHGAEINGSTVCTSDADGLFVCDIPKFLTYPMEVSTTDRMGIEYSARLFALETTDTRKATDAACAALRQIGLASNIANADIVLPADVAPDESAPVTVLAMTVDADGTRREIQGTVIRGTPLLIGFQSERVDAQGEVHTSVVKSVTLNGSSRGLTVEADSAPSNRRMTYILRDAANPSGLFVPLAMGTYTIVATAEPSGGGAPITAAYTLRAVAEGGGGVTNLPDEAPRIIRMLPKNGAGDVPVTTYAHVAFSEPVKNVYGNLRVVAKDGSVVATVLSGVSAATGAAVTLTDAGHEAVTAVTLVPVSGLAYGTEYRIEAADQIVDEDENPETEQPEPKRLVCVGGSCESRFTTFKPAEEIGSAEPNMSLAGIAVLDDRAYGVETLWQGSLQGGLQLGKLHVFNIKNPRAPEALPVGPDSVIDFPPRDIAAQKWMAEVKDEDGSETTKERKVAAVVTGGRHWWEWEGNGTQLGGYVHETPTSLMLFDVDTDTPKWIGATSLTASMIDGTPERVVLKGDFAYVATLKQGLQVVSIKTLVDEFPRTDAERKKLKGELSFNGRFVSVATTALRVGETDLLANDLEVEDGLVSGVSTTVVYLASTYHGPEGASGRVSIVSPFATTAPVLWQDEVTDARQSELTWPRATGFARVGNRQLLLIGGQGIVRCGDPPAEGCVPSGGAVSVLVVMEVTDPTAPQTLGFYPLPDLESVGDVLVTPDLTVIVSSAPGVATDGKAVIVGGLASVDFGALHLYKAGALAGIGSRMALSQTGILLSTSRKCVSDAGGSKEGVHLAALEPTCPLLSPNSSVVKISRTLNPWDNSSCGNDGRLELSLCEAAYVSIFLEDGSPLKGAIDGSGMVQPIAGIAMEAGKRVISVPFEQFPEKLKNGPDITFQVLATSIASGKLATADGLIRVISRANRCVLPVGRTFVKGVDLFDGHVVHQASDIKVPGRNLSLELTRTYSSTGQDAEGAAGAGWETSYTPRLMLSSCGLVVVVTPDGSSQTFRTSDQGATYQPQPGYHTRLRRNLDDTFDFFDKANVRHHFGASQAPGNDGALRRWEGSFEPHGDRLLPRYDVDGRVVEVGEYHGDSATPVRALSLTYTDRQYGSRRRIQSARIAALNLEVTYAYDEWGNLISATRSGRNVSGGPSAPQDVIERYEYSVGESRDRHQLTAVVDANEHRTEFIYYALGDSFPGEADHSVLVGDKQEHVKIVRELPQGTAVDTGFTYDFSQAISGKVKTTVQDPLGRTTLYELNRNGSPVKISAPLSHTTEMDWYPADITKSWEKDAEGRETNYAYDANGNLTSERVAAGDPLGEVETVYSYDQTFNKLALKRDALQRETRYTIDPADGDLTDVYDGTGHTHHEYDGAGRITRTRDQHQNDITYSDWDSYGHPQRIDGPGSYWKQRTYDARGRLTREQDSLGHDTQTTYDGLDRPVEVRRVSGQGAASDEVTTTTYYPGGQPQTVTSSRQAVTTYQLDGLNRVIRADTSVPDGQSFYVETQYDANGNKERERDARGVARRFGYDQLNRLASVTIESGPAAGPSGVVVAAYDYWPMGNKKSETDLAGRTTSFEYDGLYNLKKKTLPAMADGTVYHEEYVNDAVGNRRDARDANGNWSHVEYDAMNRVTKKTNAEGQVVTIAYDEPSGAHVNKTEEYDQAHGLRTTYQYDALNRETQRTVALEGPGLAGRVYTTRTGYSPSGQHIVITGIPGNHVTERELDGLDRAVREEVKVNGTGGDLVTQIEYDGLGGKTRVVDARGHATTYGYDGLGHMVWMQDALGHQAHYGYDGGGLKVYEQDRRNVERRFAYDNLGRQIETALVSSPISGKTWSHRTEYQDQARRRIEYDAQGRSTIYELDALDRVLSETDPGGFRAEYRYDGVNKIWQKDKAGNEASFTYDKINRLRVTQGPGTTTLETQYLDAQNQRREKNRRDIWTETQLDALGRVVSVTRSGVTMEANDYDAYGNKVLAVDGEGHKTRFTYDGANRLTSRVDAADSSEATATAYTFEDFGGVAIERDARAAAVGIDYSSRKVFDELNRLHSEADGLGHATVYGYDAEGNRTSVTEPEGQVTELSYEELGKLYTVTQAQVAVAPGGALARPVTQYAYDEDRNRILQTDANGHRVEMTYYPTNRLWTTIQHLDDRDLTTTIEAYDGNGNVLTLLDPKGQRVTSTYDQLGRLAHREYQPASGATPAWRETTAIDYSYDGNGNLTQAIETATATSDLPAVLTTIRGYDDFDRLTSEQTTTATGGTRTVGHDYWSNGTRKLVRDAQNRVTFYDYDLHNRLATATTDYGTPQALPTTYGYYKDSLLDTIAYPNGVVAKHTYDNADRLLSLTNSKAGATISSYAYQYTDNGNRDQQVEENGGLTETTTYTYDALNRLTSVLYPPTPSPPPGGEGGGEGARTVTYGYDLVGNRVVEDEVDSTSTPTSSKLATFDAANRLITVTDSVNPAQSAAFAYDDNGNQVGKTVAGVTTYYRYDLRDKMVQADQADQGPIVLGRFAYDFEGRRTFKTGESGISSSDSVRYYVYDQASLLTEYDLDQAPVSRYDYGSDRLLSLTNAYQGRRYYHFDGLRSVTNLTNDSGATSASYHLDTWGNFRFPQELDQSQNRFAFTGYQWDTATGLYNAKARYYDPIYGRFTTQDSYLGEVNDPPSIHRFFYANDNPTRYVDPTGHQASGYYFDPSQSPYQTRQQQAEVAEGERQGLGNLVKDVGGLVKCAGETLLETGMAFAKAQQRGEIAMYGRPEQGMKSMDEGVAEAHASMQEKRAWLQTADWARKHPSEALSAAGEAAEFLGPERTQRVIADSHLAFAEGLVLADGVISLPGMLRNAARTTAFSAEDAAAALARRTAQRLAEREVAVGSGEQWAKWTELREPAGLDVPSSNAPQARLLNALKFRARALELSADPAHGGAPQFNEGIGGARYEMATGRGITRSRHKGADFVDPKYGPIGLKGAIRGPNGEPIPITDEMAAGVARRAVKEVYENTATHAVVVDTFGMSSEQIAALKATIVDGLKAGGPTTKPVIIVE